MAFSRAKTGRERLRMREKENSHPEPFQPDPEEGILEKQQKNEKKIEKRHCGFFSSQNRMGHAENERKKKSFLSVASQSGIGISKKIAKKFQKLKNINMTSFQAKTRRERLRM